MRSPNQNSHIIKYADDTVILGLIDNDNETPYFDTIDYALQWCKANHLDLDVTKTKEMIHDFRHTPPAKQPVTIDDKAVEKVKAYKCLGCIIRDLKWDNHITSQIKKCNKRLFLLRQLNKLKVNSKILCLYCNAMISSVATFVIGSWYNSCGTTLLHQLARIEKQAQRNSFESRTTKHCSRLRASTKDLPLPQQRRLWPSHNTPCIAIANGYLAV